MITDGSALSANVNLDALAEATPGYTSADLASLVQMATYDAYRQAADKVRHNVKIASKNTQQNKQTNKNKTKKPLLLCF